MDKQRIHPFDMFELLEKSAASMKELIQIQNSYEQDTSVPYKGKRIEFLNALVAHG